MTLKIEIETLSNGFVVRIGTRKVHFTTVEEATTEVLQQMRLLLR